MVGGPQVTVLGTPATTANRVAKFDTTVPGPPPSGVLIPSVSSTPGNRPEARAVGDYAQRKRVREAGVLVEPGQPEALARLVALGLGALTLPPFVVDRLDPAAPLPELRPGELPRFEAKPLDVGSSGWEDQKLEPGGAASDSNEGSDS